MTFENIYFSTYCVELKRWTKFKTKSKQLDEGHICWMLDRINNSTKMPTLCEIVEKQSNRTFSVEYTSIEAKIDPDTYEIIKTGKKKCVQRPAQMLCYITSKDCEDEVATDPFVPLDDIDEEDVLMSYRPPREELIDEILPEGDKDVVTEPELLDDLNVANDLNLIDDEVNLIVDKIDSDIDKIDSTVDKNNSTVVMDNQEDMINFEQPMVDMDGQEDLIDFEQPVADILTPVRPQLQVQYDSETAEMVDIVKLVKAPAKKKKKKKQTKY